MAYFARKISYAASETSFIAFIAIARKKGGRAIKYIAYRYCIEGVHEIVEFDRFKDIQVHMPFGGNLVKWQKTSDWLYGVGAGGFHEQHKEGLWVKIFSPYTY